MSDLVVKSEVTNAGVSAMIHEKFPHLKENDKDVFLFMCQLMKAKLLNDEEIIALQLKVIQAEKEGDIKADYAIKGATLGFKAITDCLTSSTQTNKQLTILGPSVCSTYKDYGMFSDENTKGCKNLKHSSSDKLYTSGSCTRGVRASK